MATRATFIPGAGLLSVIGDSLDNTIVTSRDAAGNLLVNGGAVTIDFVPLATVEVQFRDLIAVGVDLLAIGSPASCPPSMCLASA